MTRPRTWAEEEVARIHDRSARRAASQAATYRYLYSAPPRPASRLRKALFWFGVAGAVIGCALMVGGMSGEVAAPFFLWTLFGGIFGSPRG